MSFVLGLLLSACDLRSVTELLADLQPPPADESEAPDDDASESDSAVTRERRLNRNEHVGNLRNPSRINETRRDRNEDAPSEGEDAPADEEEPQEEEAQEQPGPREPAGDGDGGGSGEEGGSGSDGESEDTGGQSSGLSEVEQQVLDLLNEARERAGRSPLQLDSELAQGSGEWSRRMATEGFFDHARGGDFAENIAYGYPSAAAVHDGWMESPGHADNRMNDRYTVYGIGVYQQGNMLYYTERFR
jgi:uncharacterized protein YkwD